jgi:hypothetical protein
MFQNLLPNQARIFTVNIVTFNVELLFLSPPDYLVLIVVRTLSYPIPLLLLNNLFPFARFSLFSQLLFGYVLRMYVSLDGIMREALLAQVKVPHLLVI